MGLLQQQMPDSSAYQLILSDMDQVILVTPEDEAIGTMEKMEAHRKGLLHRAFSVFLFDADGRMLLQQRAAGKYHGAHLWTNACCSHPLPGEEVADAVKRRLMQELGLKADVQPVFSFVYRADVENDLIEHEYDHVFAGEYGGDFQLNPMEVEAIRYEEISDIRNEVQEDPSRFTTWFRLAFPRIEAWWKEKYLK
jgi:isopentenyl-diphosphate Delta-isomerase